MTRATLVLEMLSPLPEYLDEQAGTVPLAPRPETLDGLTVGLLSNWRPSASAILDAVGDLLVSRFEISGLDKQQPVRELPYRTGGLIDPLGETLDALTEQVDVVVTATGD